MAIGSSAFNEHVAGVKSDLGVVAIDDGWQRKDNTLLVQDHWVHWLVLHQKI